MKMNKVMTLAAAAVGAAAFAADMTISTNYVLDDDLTVDGTLTVASGATVDLNGHTLSVKGLSGAGRVTDSQQYQLLDYIEATGAQRIVTDLVPNANTMLEVVAAPTVLPNSGALFGTASWATYRFLCACVNNIWYFWGNNTKVYSSVTVNTRYRFVVALNQAMLFNDATGTQVGCQGVNMANNDNSELAICGITGSTSRGNFKVYSFKVWHENAMRFDFVPARNPATGEVGLLNRLDGRLHVSDESPFVAGTAEGSLSIGSLRIAAASEAALDGFTGTKDANVRIVLDGDCTLAADTDWRRFTNLSIDGTVDLGMHELRLSDIYGTGVITNAYDRLEYVEATGTQMVNTGIVPSTDTGVEIDLTLTTAGQQNRTIFGCASWTSYRYLMILANKKFYFFGNATIFCDEVANRRYKITVTPGTSPNGTVAAVNATTGESLGSKSANLTNSDNSELNLFEYTGDTNYARGGLYRLHSFKMTKGGELRRHLVPVRKTKTGEVGLLDLVSGGFFTSCTETALVAGPVSSTGGDVPGTLRIDVAEGRTVFSESVAIGSALKFVKEGAGTLVANRAGQTYSGGTRIALGAVELMNGGPGVINAYISARNFFGVIGNDTVPGPEIVIDTGAVFDFKGHCNYRFYTLILNGGTLRNSGYDMAQNSGSLGTVKLTADSTLDFAFNTTVFDVPPIHFDLGGHELTVSALTAGKQLYFRNTGTITNGTFWLKNNTDWRINSAINARGATLRAEGTLWIGATLDVDNYYAACTTNINNGTAAMNVYGRFTPATDYFYGCTLQDGAILDLNGRNGAWSTTSAFTSGLNRVTFASGATITVDVSTRPTFRGKIVDWGAGNTPSDVTFRLDAASKAMGRALRVKDDGLYTVSGVLIIVR